jgi:hypothetical protein
MTSPQEEKDVRIRITWEDRTLFDRTVRFSESQIPGVADGISVKEIPAEGAAGKIGIGAVGVIFSVPFAYWGWIGGMFSGSSTVQVVKVFIETAIAGPALAALINAIAKSLVDEVRSKLADTKLKKAKIILYGPDGKEIDLDSKRRRNP